MDINTSRNITSVLTDKCAAGHILVYWLGGSGFVFKSADGKTICIDPYLSNSVEKQFGFRRLTLPPVTPDRLHFNMLLITHDHADHLDTGSFDALMDANPNCTIWASPSCDCYLKSTAVSYSIASPDDSMNFGEVSITALNADHGELCPTALGFMVTFGTRKLYFTGDTAYNRDLLSDSIAQKPEIIIPCINGAFGNMDASMAARLAKECGSRIAFPSHYGMFAEHGGSPEDFVNAVRSISPSTRVELLAPGTGIEI
ncbi:MAG TPA: MBL fold metallo-hydrolase [Armatimonadota bacterium]